MKDLKGFINMSASFMERNRPKGAAYSSIFDFVSKNGREYKAKAAATMTRNRCFENAYKLAKARGWIYVEGYARPAAGLPVLHAWVVDPETGEALDPTWTHAENAEYFGCAFPIWYVERIIFERKYYGVIDAMEIGYPLLTGRDKYPINTREEK